jgi:hypothetical protein
MKSNKTTRQGVRDLNHMKSKSVGVKLPMPPLVVMCEHKNVNNRDSRNSYCVDCKQMF